VLIAAAGGLFAGVLLHAADATALGSSVRAVFESHGLIGIYAVDCGRRASRSNFYYVNRALDDGHVQFDVMSGPTTRYAETIIDQARDVTSDEIYVNGTHDDGRALENVWRFTANRTDEVEYSLGGKKQIANTKWLSDGVGVAPMYKCAGGISGQAAPPATPGK